MRNYIGKLGSLRDRHLKNLSFANAARRNIYQRRLLCEPLEDRRLLSVSVPSLNSGILSVGSTSISVQFDSAMLGADVAANYQLQRAGVDGLLGTADDVVVPLTVSYQETTAGNSSTLTFAALPEEVYRLTVRDAITDAAGNKIDGDGDGMAGGDWSADFVVICIESSSTSPFTTAATYAVGAYPWGIATGDLNADGKLDLVVANNNSSGTVQILIGKGDGTFSSGNSCNSGGNSPRTVKIADLNNDHKLDIVVANEGNGKIGILYGDGTGIFSAITSYSTVYSAQGLAFGDYNKDGKLDIATTSWTSDSVGLLLSNSSGGFTTTSIAVEDTWPDDIVAADFNRDGRLDLAVVNGFSDTVRILLGNRSNGFTVGNVYNTGLASPKGIAIGDFNSDGWVDVVVSGMSSNAIAVLLGDGAGGFGNATSYATNNVWPIGIVVADFNNDGIQDISTGNNGDGTVTILLGDGNGKFLKATTLTTGIAAPQGIVVGDFNRDGHPDLAVSNNGNGTVGIFLNALGLASATMTCANAFAFEIQTNGAGAGQLVEGSNNAFDGLGRLIVDGIEYDPGKTIYTLADGEQTVVTGNDTINHLTVSREITIPYTGSENFARTIDSFTNTTDKSITTTVTIVGNLGSDGNTMVFATSDGDTIVETTDQWIGTDDVDGSGTPAIIHYIHGSAGLQPASVSVVGDNITWAYEITIAAGETVQLASFTIVGVAQAEAMAAANILVRSDSFGGQAAAYHYMQSLLNFIITNTAPVLTAASPTLGATNPNAALTVSLKTFINAKSRTTTITDADSEPILGGIALTATTGNGTWSYSLDGTTFVDFGIVNEESALLLPSTAMLRYTPNASGGETATVTYRAWDTTSGIAGTKVDTSTNGGTTAFSTANDIASVTIDGTPPTIKSISTIIAGTVAAGTSKLTIDFDSVMVGAFIYANYTLLGAGTDYLLGTSDDVQ